MALRGKVLNAEKTEPSRLLGNKEINDIITAIGAGFGKDFNIKKIRYDKIILMTDADVDGSHIDILLLTFFYKYMRKLIEEGHIYITVPPLYRAVKGSSYTYLKDDKALEEYRKKNATFDLQRFKGLGEMNASQLWETTMDPENRTLKQITIEDASMASKLITDLMGKEVIPRKDFIAKNGAEVGFYI